MSEAGTDISIFFQKSTLEWNELRAQGQFPKPDLRNMDLSQRAPTELETGEAKGEDLNNVNLAEADLREADLRGADFSGANLRGADLRKARIQGAKLNDANLWRAKLQGADLRLAELHRADLRFSSFKGAKLAQADFKDAKLGEASFEETDLRSVSGLTLDRTITKGARFPQPIDDWKPHAGYKSIINILKLLIAPFKLPERLDEWNVLRRRYTGFKAMLNILLFLIALLPYASQTLFWFTVGQGQMIARAWTQQAQAVAGKTIQETQESLESAEARLRTLNEEGSPAGEELLLAAEKLRDLRTRIAEQEQRSIENMTQGWQEYRIWKILIGLHKPGGYWIIIVCLLIYNLFRGFLTWMVVNLQEDEDRSGYSPKSEEYLWLNGLDVLVRGLFWISMLSFLYHIHYWLATVPVWIPPGQ